MMSSEIAATTANYADSTVDPDRECTMLLSCDKPILVQTARLNSKDNSRVWDIADVPLPACDIKISKIAGIKVKTGSGGAAHVFVVWYFERDDVVIESFSSST